MLVDANLWMKRLILMKMVEVQTMIVIIFAVGKSWRGHVSDVKLWSCLLQCISVVGM